MENITVIDMNAVEGEYSLVPESDIRSRIKQLQNWLLSQDLDGALLFQHVDIYYFSGTLQRSILFVPAEGRPLLMVIKSMERAKNESPLSTILPIRGRGGLFPTLTDYNYTKLDRVGLELDVLPAAHYLWFVKHFPKAEIVDVSMGIRQLRMIKSSYEIEQLRRAAVITDKGYQTIRGLIREGMTELEIDGLLFSIARQQGHMGRMRMRGWNQEMINAHVFTGPDGAAVSCGETPSNGMGVTPALPQGPGWGRVTRNQPIYIDYGVVIGGYHCDQTRTLVLGDLEPTLSKAHACSKEILETLEAQITPGMPCRDIYEEAKKIAAQRGFADHFMGFGEGQVKFLGHGLGLEIDEFPVFAAKFDMPVQEGMVFALEPKFSFPGVGIVGIEDDYRVTAKGVERLTVTEQDVMHISV